MDRRDWECLIDGINITLPGFITYIIITVLTPYVLRKSSVSMGFHALEAAKLSVMATAATVVPGSSPAAASLMLVITESVYRSSAFILLNYWDLSCPVKNRADPTAQRARAAAPRASAVMEATIAAAPFALPAVRTTAVVQVHVLGSATAPLGTTSGSSPV